MLRVCNRITESGNVWPLFAEKNGRALNVVAPWNAEVMPLESHGEFEMGKEGSSSEISIRKLALQCGTGRAYLSIFYLTIQAQPFGCCIGSHPPISTTAKL